MLSELKGELEKLGSPEKARIMQRFFKTGPGQYGEGDVFIGVRVPEQRAVARKYASLPLKDIQKLLNSKVHEHRLTGLVILANRFTKTSDVSLYRFYLANTARINNWDLVDVTAPNVVGTWLLEHPGERKLLYRLACSKNLWERRIAIISTLAFIREGEFEDTLKISEILLGDSHDLIHKAVGWMLREVGKKDEKALTGFLDRNIRKMPRTALRYSIEKLPENKRRMYMER